MSIKKKQKRNVWLVVIAFVLLILAGLFAYKPVKSKNSAFKEIDKIMNDPQSEWLGMYLKGYKVGYVVSRTETLPQGYRVFSYTYMRINPVSTQQKEVKYLVKALTDTEFDIRTFKFIMESGDYRFTASGEKRGDLLTINYVSGGEKRNIKKKLKIPHLPATLEGLVQMGRTGTFQFYDPTTQSLMEIVARKTGEGIYGGAKVDNYIVEMGGIKVNFIVSKDGRLLREESPIGVTMIRESKEEAMKIEGMPSGLYASYAVKTDKPIKNPRNLDYLKVKLLNVDPSGLSIQDDRQKLNDNILTIKTVSPLPKFTIPDSLKKYTEPEEFIPSDDPMIVKKAKEIAGNLKGWDAVKRINLWVFTKLKKKPTFSIPEPTEVLKTMEGDCNEHSALFVALVRAIGIPARVEVGLVYFGDGFYYHAWAGVWLGKWVSVDPTFGQNLADATHIKLEQGGFENQVKLYRVINRLKIQVLGYD